MHIWGLLILGLFESCIAAALPANPNLELQLSYYASCSSTTHTNSHDISARGTLEPRGCAGSKPVVKPEEPNDRAWPAEGQLSLMLGTKKLLRIIQYGPVYPPVFERPIANNLMRMREGVSSTDIQTDHLLSIKQGELAVDLAISVPIKIEKHDITAALLKLSMWTSGS